MLLIEKLKGLSLSQLAQLRSRTANREHAQPPLLVLSREGREEYPRDEYPLSFSQKTLWTGQQLYPESSAYHVAGLLAVEEGVDAELLERAISSVVQRHEVLRTVFPQDERGEPVQRVLPAQGFELQRRSIDSPQALRAHARQFTRRAFDLAQGPLLRAELLDTWDGRRLLLWCMHEIVADGSSSVILQREVQAFLRGEREGRPHEPGPLPIQYKDYAVWQSSEAGMRDYEQRRAYWHAQLCGALTRLQLPFDLPAAGQVHLGRRGAKYRFSLPSALCANLSALCRDKGVTLFMLLNAALAAWLARLTGSLDIVVAAPVAGRERAEVQGLIGFFLNTVLLRTRVSLDEPFEALLARSREDILQALQHQAYPFEKLLEELSIPRLPGQFPATPVLLNMLSFMDKDAQPDGAAAHAEVDRDVKVEFELYAREHADSVAFECHYRADLFKSSTIEYLMQQWHHLLEQLAASPSARILHLDLFSEREFPIKHDLEAQRAPGAGHAGSQVAEDLPPTPLESVLTDMFKEVLERTAVGRHDDFFSLGGHSLRATMLLSRIRKHLDIELSARVLFEHPTVAGLSRELDRMRSPGASPPADKDQSQLEPGTGHREYAESVVEAMSDAEVEELLRRLRMGKTAGGTNP